MSGQGGSAPRVVIALALRERGTTGVQTHVGVARQLLRERGIPVRVVTPFQNPRWLVYPVVGARRILDPVSATAGVTWYRRGHARLLGRAIRRVLAEAAGPPRPTVIYAQDPISAGAALAARPSPDVRVVMVAHYNISQADEWAGKGQIRSGSRTYREILAFDRAVLPRLHGIVYVSEDVRRHTEERVEGLAAVPSIVVPNFLYDPGVPDAVARGDLVTVGSLEPRKNQGYLLEVLAAAAALGVRPTLTVIGDGRDRRALEGRAAALGLGGQVRFLGAEPNAIRLLAGHRLYVHAARMESFGLALVEAMASGLPVLAAPVGGIPEVFRDGVEGRFWPLDDAPAAARILGEMLAGGERLAAMGGAARARFLASFEAHGAGGALADFLVERAR